MFILACMEHQESVKVSCQSQLSYLDYCDCQNTQSSLSSDDPQPSKKAKKQPLRMMKVLHDCENLWKSENEQIMQM